MGNSSVWTRNDLALFLDNDANYLMLIWYFERMRRMQDVCFLFFCLFSMYLSYSFLFVYVIIYYNKIIVYIISTIYLVITCYTDAEFDDDNERGRKGDTKLRSYKCQKTST